MPPEGIEIVQRSRLRENSGSMEFGEMKEVSRRSPRELKIVRYIIRLEDLTKSVKWRAYVMSGGVPTRLLAQHLPQGKEKLPLREILCLKRRSCLPPPALYSDWIAQSKYNGVVETSESIEPNDTDLELNAIGYSSLKCSKQTFTVRSAMVNSFTSAVLSSEANGETGKNLSLLWKISVPSSGIQLKNS